MCFVNMASGFGTTPSWPRSSKCRSSRSERELAKLTHGHRHRWQTLIEDIRQLYSGKLVYAANWGKEVQQVDFWDLLDYIGVDFYYPLSAHEHPSDEELEKGFEAALGQVRALHERHRKPVILTEIGYDGHRGFTPNGKAAEDVLRRWYGSRLQ